MNRIGWIVLAIFALAGALFILLLDPDGVAEQTPVPEAGPAPRGGLAMPVSGIDRSALSDSFTQARDGGARVHNAIDVMAPRGTPVVAAARGRVEKIFESEAGGHTVYVRSRDRRTVYYYAHLDAYADGLREGRTVKRGDPIGTVGSSGNAQPAGPHLHFEVKAMRPGEAWYEGRAVNPYPLLAGTAPAR